MKTGAKPENVPKKQASLFQNIWMVSAALLRAFPSCRWQLPFYMLCTILAPFMATLIPSLAIRMITEGNVWYFLAVITISLAAYWGRQAAQNIADMYLNHAAFYTAQGFFFTSFIKKALTTDYLNIEPQAKQKMIQRADLAVSNARILIYEAVDFTIRILGLLIYGFTVLVLDVRILLVTLVLFVLDILLRNYAIQYGNEHWEEHTEITRKRNYLERSSLDISAGKDIRIYRIRDCFHAHFNDLIAKEKDFQTKRTLCWYYSTFSDGVLGAVRDILAYGILIDKVLSGELDAAGFTLYLGVIAGLTGWIYPLALSLSRLREANLHFGDYNTFMNLADHFVHTQTTNGCSEDLKSGAQSSSGKMQAPYRGCPDREATAPSIEFRDVSFCYEGCDTPVFSHLSFFLRAGEKVALVGNNGAGKTTLVKLLCGLYPVCGGEIRINGKSLACMDLNTWQQEISVVFQDAIPMAFSVAMNVAGQSKEELDSKRVKESLMRAGLWEKIESLPNREETFLTQQLDENGLLLSGGELQKLLLARAIYKNGSMLILDEPTAALDPIAESAMYEEYNVLADGKTSLFISHRLASTKFCDRILFLENGQIAESGTHAELMQKNGKYREMFDIQSHYYKNEIKTGQETTHFREEGI